MNRENASQAELLALLPESERSKILNEFTNEELYALEYDWPFWARKNQLEPGGNWQYWLLLAGRGFGKTRCGSEWIRDRVESGKSKIIHLVAPTAADARDTMVEGESGILAIFPPEKKPLYEPSKRKITFHNGAVAHLFSAEEPERLRGPQCDTAWCDEIAAWKYPNETWDMLMFGFRLGDNPQCVITTTPKPIPLIKELVRTSSVMVTKGTTYDNAANLAPAFMDTIISKYEGTRLGRQELNAEILDDNPDALWQRKDIDDNRVSSIPNLIRIVVGVDPAATSKQGSDDTGVIVAGIDAQKHGYVLGDYTCHTTPQKWAHEVIAAYNKHKADRVVGETNNGGEMVEHTLRTVDPTISFKAVHASRGKQTRAEPISSYYEQGRIHHVGSFPALEDQMCLSGDTMVETIGGAVRIDEITPGTLVYTRCGPKRVLWAGMTSVEEDVIEITTVNGRNLLATMGHLIYVENRGYTKVSDLHIGDVLKTWKNMAPESNMTEDIIQSITADTIETNTQVCYTGLCGKTNMVQSQTVLSSTTLMKTDKTTQLKTLQPLRCPGTSCCTPVESVYGDSMNTASILKTRGRIENHVMSSVKDVEKCLNLQECEQCIVQDHVEEDTIISLKKHSQKIPVYNIKVAGVPEFFANGVLVHNCDWVPGLSDSPDRVDALVWALTELLPPEKPKQAVPRFVGGFGVSGGGLRI